MAKTSIYGAWFFIFFLHHQCGCKYFRQVNAFKRISALVSPTGKEQIVPVPTFRCDECGFINDEFRPVEQKIK